MDIFLIVGLVLHQGRESLTPARSLFPAGVNDYERAVPQR
jgi:hypothetical protein